MQVPALRALVTERHFSEAVVGAAALLGWETYRTWRSDHSPAGFPDIVAARGDRLVFAELKTEAGRLRPEQRLWLDALAATPAETYLWRPSAWPQIEAVLARPAST